MGLSGLSGVVDTRVGALSLVGVGESCLVEQMVMAPHLWEVGLLSQHCILGQHEAIVCAWTIAFQGFDIWGQGHMLL